MLRTSADLINWPNWTSGHGTNCKGWNDHFFGEPDQIVDRFQKYELDPIVDRFQKYEPDQIVDHFRSFFRSFFLSFVIVFLIVSDLLNKN